MKKQKKKRGKKYIPKKVFCGCLKNDILDFMSTLSFVDLSRLIEELEDAFGVSTIPEYSEDCKILEQIKIIPFHIIKNDEFNLKSRRS